MSPFLLLYNFLCMLALQSPSFFFVEEEDDLEDDLDEMSFLLLTFIHFLVCYVPHLPLLLLVLVFSSFSRLNVDFSKSFQVTLIRQSDLQLGKVSKGNLSLASSSSSSHPIPSNNQLSLFPPPPHISSFHLYTLSAFSTLLRYYCCIITTKSFYPFPSSKKPGSLYQSLARWWYSGRLHFSCKFFLRRAKKGNKMDDSDHHLHRHS